MKTSTCPHCLKKTSFEIDKIKHDSFIFSFARLTRCSRLELPSHVPILSYLQQADPSPRKCYLCRFYAPANTCFSFDIPLNLRCPEQSHLVSKIIFIFISTLFLCLQKQVSLTKLPSQRASRCISSHLIPTVQI